MRATIGRNMEKRCLRLRRRNEGYCALEIEMVYIYMVSILIMEHRKKAISLTALRIVIVIVVGRMVIVYRNGRRRRAV